MPHDMEIKLKHLTERKRRDRRVFVVRRGKTPNQSEREVALRLRPGMPGFLDEYQAAVATLYPLPGMAAAIMMSAAPTPSEAKDFPANSLGWLVKRYLSESVPLKMMKPAGKSRRRKAMMELSDRHGSKPMMIPTAAIAKGFSDRLEKPGAANDWLKAIKALYSWSTSMGITPSNPADAVRKIRNKTDGFHIWSLVELRAYTARHPFGTMAYLALALLLLHGLRRDDASKFGRQHIRDGKIRFITGKTETPLVMTASPLFLAAADALPKRDQLAFLLNAWDRPFASGNAFGNWFKDRCAEAGIPHCTAHGVRKAAASIAREHGASDGQLDAMFTWADTSQRGTYTAGADQLKLATGGFRILESALVREGVLGGPAGQTGNRFGKQP